VLATKAFDPVEMALKNAVRIECLRDPITAVEAIVRRCQKTALMMQYNLADFDNTNEMLCMMARKMGKLRRGGVPDTKMAARKLLRDWNSGKLRYYTEPPEDEGVSPADEKFLSSELVAEMSKEFDLDAIDADQKLLVEGLPANPLAEVSSVVLTANASSTTNDEPMENVDDEDDEDFESDEDRMEVDDSSSTKVRTEPSSRKSRAASPSRAIEDTPEMQLEGNRQSNKMLRKAMKKKKKKVKRTEKLATNLSDAMDVALSSFTVGSSKKKTRKGDDYDFDEHFT